MAARLLPTRSQPRLVRPCLHYQPPQDWPHQARLGISITVVPHRLFTTTHPRSEKVLDKVVVWAAKHGVGFPAELQPIKLPPDVNKVVRVKYSPRRTLDYLHVLRYFVNYEHPLTEYRLLQYEEKLVDPLWVRIVSTRREKPVIRNFAKRRVRQAIHQALTERGLTAGGRPVDGAESSGLSSAVRLRGTLWIDVIDPLSILHLDRAKCLSIGGDIVKAVETSRSVYPVQGRNARGGRFGTHHK